MRLRVGRIFRTPSITGCGSLCGLFVLTVLFAPFAHADSPPPQILLDDVNIKRDGVVKFTALFQAGPTPSDFPQPQFLIDQTDDQAFRLCIDTDSIQPLRFNAFNFTAYLIDVKSGGKTFQFKITGDPSGSFRDTSVRVSFHVKSATAISSGTLQRLPVYNAAKTDLLVFDPQKEPQYVSGDRTPVQIPLNNTPDSLPIVITDVAVVPACPKCWKQIVPAVSDKKPLTIDPDTKTDLAIDLFPNTVPALLRGAVVIQPDTPHDTLSLVVTYHTSPNGTDRKQTIPLKVRFGPGFLGLTLAVCCGIGLGLAAKYFLTDQLGKQNERVIHAVLSALVLGILAEVIGFMMTSYGNSKLILFDLDIDPRQLFPAFVLAILVTGGSAVVAWMKGLFGKQA